MSKTPINELYETFRPLVADTDQLRLLKKMAMEAITNQTTMSDLPELFTKLFICLVERKGLEDSELRELFYKTCPIDPKLYGPIRDYDKNAKKYIAVLQFKRDRMDQLLHHIPYSHQDAFVRGLYNAITEKLKTELKGFSIIPLLNLYQGELLTKLWTIHMKAPASR